MKNFYEKHIRRLLTLLSCHLISTFCVCAQSSKLPPSVFLINTTILIKGYSDTVINNQIFKAEHKGTGFF